MAGANGKYIYSAEEQVELVRYIKMFQSGELQDTDDRYFMNRLYKILWESINGLVYDLLSKTYGDLFKNNRDDMLQYAMGGLWQPTMDYDPETMYYNPPKGKDPLQYNTYISRWVYHCGSEWINENVNQMTAHYGNIKKKYYSEIKRLESEGIAWNDQMIAELIGESVTSIKKMKEKELTGSGAIHYDAPDGSEHFRDNATAQPLNVVSQRPTSPEEGYEKKEIEDNIKAALARLDPKRREAVKYKYGFYGNKDISDAYIASKLGIKGGADDVKKLIASGCRDIKRLLQDDPLFEDRQISSEVEELRKNVAFKDPITDNDIFAALEFTKEVDLSGDEDKK